MRVQTLSRGFVWWKKLDSSCLREKWTATFVNPTKPRLSFKPFMNSATRSLQVSIPNFDWRDRGFRDQNFWTPTLRGPSPIVPSKKDMEEENGTQIVHFQCLPLYLKTYENSASLPKIILKIKLSMKLYKNCTLVAFILYWKTNRQ